MLLCHLKQKGRKVKQKSCTNYFNKMGPKSLTNLFTYEGEMTNKKLWNISCSLCLPKPRTKNMKNVLCMT
jgi:hypothetical protein